MADPDRIAELTAATERARATAEEARAAALLALEEVGRMAAALVELQEASRRDLLVISALSATVDALTNEETI